MAFGRRQKRGLFIYFINKSFGGQDVRNPTLTHQTSCHFDEIICYLRLTLLQRDLLSLFFLKFDYEKTLYAKESNYNY
jgi:hypothetical protein